MREDPRLAQIRKLDKDLPPDAMASWQFRKEVRTILGAPPVDATPPQAIDRDALTKLALDLFEASMLWGRGDDIPEPNIEVFVGAVLALVRPVEGVVIEPPYQAAVHKLLWTALLPDTDLTLQERTEGEHFLAALAARLEAGHE